MFDVAEFHRLRRADDRQTLERAFALRRGQFIEGPVPEDTAFADWIDDNRRSLDNLWCEATARLLRVLEREGDHRRSLEVAGRLLSVDPLCELAHQSVIRAHLAMNNRSFALRHYQGVPGKARSRTGRGTRRIDPANPAGCVSAADRADRICRSIDSCHRSTQAEGLDRRPAFRTVRSKCRTTFTSPTGLAEDLNTGLSRFADLAVIAQASVREYAQSARAGRADSIPTIWFAAASGGRSHRVRVTASLVHSADGAMLWSERFDRDFSDLFALQDDIVRRIVAVLAARVEAFEMEKTLQKPVIDYEAYDLFLKARFLQRESSKEGILAARALLREAIAREPGFASAYAELSLGYLAEYESDWSTDHDARSGGRRSPWPRKRSRSILPTATAHRALAAAQFYCNRNFDAAKAHADMALVQNPNDQYSMCFLGFALTCNGHVAEGQSYSAESFKLNPLVPEACLLALALGAYLEGNFADAVNGFARISGAYDEALACLAAALWNLGQRDAAHAAMQQFMTLKRQKMAEYPGNDAEQWRSYLLRLIPIADHAGAGKTVRGIPQCGSSGVKKRQTVWIGMRFRFRAVRHIFDNNFRLSPRLTNSVMTALKAKAEVDRRWHRRLILTRSGRRYRFLLVRLPVDAFYSQACGNNCSAPPALSSRLQRCDRPTVHKDQPESNQPHPRKLMGRRPFAEKRVTQQQCTHGDQQRDQ